MTSLKRHVSLRQPSLRSPMCWAALAVAALALGAPAYAAPDNLLPFGDLETGTPQEIFQWRSHPGITLRQGDAAQGQRAILLPRGKKGDVVLKGVPLAGNRAYRLRFMAKVTGPGAVADDIAVDPQHANQRARHTRELATWRVEYRNDENKAVDRGHPLHFQRIIHSTWTEYLEDHYAPAGATRCVLIFSNGSADNELAVDDIALTPLDLPTVNLNPDLSVGPLNMSGYNYAHQTRLLTTEQDGRYLDTAPEGWIIADPFPVEPRRYRLTFKARRANTGWPGVRVQFIDAQGKKISDSVTTHLKSDRAWHEYTYDFAPPANTVRARLIFGGQGHYASFHVTPLD